jgi:hypothetical protein
MQNEHPLFKTTRVNALPSQSYILRKESMLWMGSCFVESMSEYLKRFQYQALVNPYGVVFHPLVLQRLLDFGLAELSQTNFEKDGVWQNFMLGAPFVGKIENELNRKIGIAYAQIQEKVKSIDWLVMTWGTAFWYEHEEYGMVGKCHKFPQTRFKKRLSNVDEIVKNWSIKIKKLRSLNKELKIILTVSPVRHTRDTLEGNSVSKSTLRLAIQQLTEQFDFVHYFPAYEIVIDELRDYRFFEKDLIHPNKEAVGYIWEQFSKQFLDANEQKTNFQIQSIELEESHKSNVNYGIDFEKFKYALESKRKFISEKLQVELRS